MDCPYCGSEYTHFDRRKDRYVCEDCGRQFTAEEAAAKVSGTDTASAVISTSAKGQANAGRSPAGGKAAVPMKIFFSYGHDRYREIVLRVKADLEERGHKVFIDTSEIRAGDDWRKKIHDSIIDSDRVLGFVSDYSQRDKGPCIDELGIAVCVRYASIMPILLERDIDSVKPEVVKKFQFADLRDWDRHLQDSPEAFEAWYKVVFAQIVEFIEGEGVTKRYRQIEQLRNVLVPGENETKLDIRCEFTGRGWLFDLIDEWNNDSGASKVLALYGGPGSGKSAIASRLLYQSASVMAGVACEYHDAASNAGGVSFDSVDMLIRLIAFRMAVGDGDYASALQYAISGKEINAIKGEDLFRLLITGPLPKTMDAQRGPQFILIDGLDEVRPDQRRLLTEFISRYKDRFPAWLKIMVTSRPEVDITQSLQGCRVIDLEKHEDDNEEDVKAYFTVNLADLLGGDPEAQTVIDNFTLKSEGNFLYAKNVVEALHTKDPDRPFDIHDYDKYPASLWASFELNFSRKFPDMGDYDKNYRTALSMMIASPEPLPERALRGAMEELDIWHGETDFDKFILRLHSFLEIRKNIFGEPTLKLYHKALAEWLCMRDSLIPLTVYHVSREDGLKYLAGHCYTVCNAVEEIPGYELTYATRLLRGAKMRDEYLELVKDPAFTNKMFRIEQNLGNKFEYDSAMGLCDELRKIFDGLRKEFPDVWEYSREYGRACSDTGDMFEDRLWHDKAYEYYDQSLEIIEKLAAEHPDDPKAQRDLSISYEEIGRILEAKGDTDSALEYYKKSLEIFEKLAADHPDDPQAQRSLSVSYEKIGGILEAKGDNDGALGYYNKGLAICEKLAAEDTDDPQAQRDLSVSYIKIGSILETKGDIDGAMEYYNKALAISEKLAAEHPDDPEAQRDLSISYNRIGDILKAKGDTVGALEYYNKDLAISEKLATEHPDDPQAQRALSISYEHIGDIQKAKGDTDDALEYYNKSLAIREKLAAEHPGDPQAQRDLSVSYERIGNILEAKGDTDGAMEYHNKGLEIAEKLAAEHPDDPQAQSDLSFSYDKIGEILAVKGDYDGALGYYNKGLAISKKLAAEHPDDPQAQRDLSISYDNIGDILEAKGDTDGAMDNYNKSLTIREILAAGHPDDPQAQRDLSASYNRIGDILEDKGDTDGAMESYKKSLVISKKLAAEHPDDPQAQRDLSVSYEKIGDILEDKGDTDSALEYYKKSLEIREKLAAEHPDDPQTQDDLAVSYYKIGTVSDDMDLLIKAYEILATLFEKYPSISSFAEKRDILKDALDSFKN